MKDSLCIIPARKGSKRIKSKNIKFFNGNPIISYAIRNAFKSKLFDDIIVSTDCSKIAKISESFGASVPFLRSKENSNDYATTVDVILEVLNSIKNKDYKYICCLYPCTPLLNPNNLIKAKRKLIKFNFDIVFPILRFSFPIQRALKKENK